MTTDTQPTQEQSTPTTPTLETASYADYERMRRGEPLSTSEQHTSAPEADEAPEQKAASESEPEETEADESETEGEESADEELEASKEDESGKEEKPKGKKGGFQRRIEKLNARAAEALRRAEAAEQRLAQLEADSKKPTEPTETEQKAATTDGEPQMDAFETYTEYAKALARWEVRQEFEAREAKAQEAKRQAEEQARVNAHRERVQKFAASVEDWEDVIESVADVRMSLTVQTELLNSENGPELMYELAKNREELERICSLGPVAAARELGKFETRIAKQASAEEKKPEPKKLTKAPKPIEPVGASKGSAKKTPEEMSYADYERWRRDQERRRSV